MSQPSYDLFIDPRFAEIYRRQPIVLVDVGARGGLKSNWTAARRHLQMIGFEPDKREHARLADRGASGETIFDVALNNERGPVRLHVAKDRGLTSIYEPDRDFLATFPDPDRFETVAIESVDGDTLDSLRGAQQIRDIDFVKADTQGSELLVLQGARQSLVASAIGVEVEAEFTPIYKQQPVFADVDAYLRQLGYLLFDLRPCYWKRAAGRDLGGPRGQIIWTDALYLKSLPALRDTIDGFEAVDRKGKALKAVSIALLYGYCDYALEIARALAPVFSPDERRVIDQRLLASVESSGPLAAIPGSRRIAASLVRLAKWIRPRSRGWSVSNADLGNLR